MAAIILLKAHVKAHARRLPSGQVVQVAAHTDRRHTTLAPGQLALFTRHGEPMKPNPYKGKDPVKDTPDLFEHINPPRAAAPAAPPPPPAPEPAPAPAEPARPAKPHPLERSRATMAEYQKDHDDAVAEGDTGTAEFMQHLLGTHREGHEALEAAFGHFDKHGDGLELSHKDVRRHVIFLPDASNPGKYRYQMFDARGMMSHSTHDSPEEAVADAASSGYTVHNPGVLDKLASTEEWEEGMAINALIQAHGSGQFGYPEFVKRVKAVQEEFKVRRDAREAAANAAAGKSLSAKPNPGEVASGGAISNLGRVMRRAGWEIEFVDLDLAGDTPKAEIKVQRNDGRWLFAKVDAQGRASFETFQRDRKLGIDPKNPQARLSPQIDDAFLGRMKFEGARSMLRGMTQYLVDNATNPVQLADMRAAWAPMLSGGAKIDSSTPTLALTSQTEDDLRAKEVREPAMAKALDFGTVAPPTVLSFKAALLAGLVPQC